MFTDPSRTPNKTGYLDRLRIPAAAELPQELQDKQITSAVNQILEKGQRENKPLYQTAWDIGAFLIQYSGISDKVSHMVTLEGAFARLGRNVAFVTDALKTTLLMEEESVWLGRLKVDFSAPGGRVFEMSETLERLSCIKDCDSAEKLVLGSHYLSGKSGFWGQRYANDGFLSSDIRMPVK